MTLGKTLRSYGRAVWNIASRPALNRRLRAQAPADIAALVRQLAFDESPHRVLIGPVNTAGQGTEWARALDATGRASARSLRSEAVGLGTFRYETDVVAPRSVDAGDMTPWREKVLESITTAIFESCRPILGDFDGGTCLDDTPALLEAGAMVGALMHGSDVRDGTLHAQQVEYSPFAEASDRYFRRVSAIARRNREILREFPGPVFVSTPDLLSHVPGSTWLPLVVDVDRFTTSQPLLERDRPVVLHAPSNPLFKGTAYIDPILSRLDAEGLITYRHIRGVPHEQMPAFIADADIMVDHVVLGAHGVQAAESMAAGRLVLANISQITRDAIARDLPIVHVTPENLEDLIRDAVADRETYRAIAAEGPAYVREIHDGRRAAEVLTDAFGM